MNNENQQLTPFLQFDQNKVSEVLHDNNIVIPTKIKKETTFIVLLKLVNNISRIYDQEDNIDGEFDNIEDAFNIDTDSSALRSLSLRTFITIRGNETLRKNIEFLITNCKFIDLENSFIISDNKNITESLEMGNNLIKYIKSKFGNGNTIINNYLKDQEEYLESSGTEYLTYNNEYEQLLNVVNNMTPLEETINNNEIPDDIREEYENENGKQQSE